MTICRIILQCQISLQKGYIDFLKILHTASKCLFSTLSQSSNIGIFAKCIFVFCIFVTLMCVSNEDDSLWLNKN